MRNQYTTRRGATWGRNQNLVRHERRSMGTLSSVGIIGGIVVILAMFYVAQGTKATSYDYQLAEMEDTRAELMAQKEDLAVEKARLTAVTTAAESAVAAEMEDAVVTGYVAE